VSLALPCWQKAFVLKQAGFDKSVLWIFYLYLALERLRVAVPVFRMAAYFLPSGLIDHLGSCPPVLSTTLGLAPRKGLHACQLQEAYRHASVLSPMKPDPEKTDDFERQRT